MAEQREIQRSSYFESPDPDIRARGTNCKITEIDGHDPFFIPVGEWSKDFDLLPTTLYPDLYTYLVLKASHYTNDQFKAFKGLAAYNQFISGWVQDVQSHKPKDGENVVVKAKVLHSQRLSEKPLEPWAILANDGSIISAHCKCMAGRNLHTYCKFTISAGSSW